MVNSSALIRCTVGLGLAAALSIGAEAQPANGAMGAESRASVRISVSVMPRFDRSSDRPTSVQQPGDVAGPNFSSNMPGLRFSLFEASAAAADAGDDIGSQIVGKPRLFLITPD